MMFKMIFSKHRLKVMCLNSKQSEGREELDEQRGEENRERMRVDEASKRSK